MFGHQYGYTLVITPRSFLRALVMSAILIGFAWLLDSCMLH